MRSTTSRENIFITVGFWTRNHHTVNPSNSGDHSIVILIVNWLAVERDKYSNPITSSFLSFSKSITVARIKEKKCSFSWIKVGNRKTSWSLLQQSNTKGGYKLKIQQFVIALRPFPRLLSHSEVEKNSKSSKIIILGTIWTLTIDFIQTFRN